MKRQKGGFTLIEVSLFLAITALLFLAVTIGVNNSVFQQRYNDSVQSLVEFLRAAYAETENVQSTTGGRTNHAIYGKLVTFGEEYDLNGEKNESDKVFTYNVAGKIDGDIGTGGALSALKNADADVVTDGKLNGIVESFTPKWQSQIQVTGKDKIDEFKGAILIVRHPRSGTVYTLVMDKNTIEVNRAIKEGSSSILGNYLNKDKEPHFDIKQLDFCVNPNGAQQSGLRADVRIGVGARNSAAIEVITDGENNMCSN